MLLLFLVLKCIPLLLIITNSVFERVFLRMWKLVLRKKISCSTCDKAKKHLRACKSKREEKESKKNWLTFVSSACMIHIYKAPLKGLESCFFTWVFFLFIPNSKLQQEFLSLNCQKKGSVHRGVVKPIVYDSVSYF